MSRAPKDLKANPLGAAPNPHGIIDFVDAVHMHTPLENVVGGPPAYLESHGIRYVPDPGPATLGADGELAPYEDHLSTAAPPAGEPGPFYTQRELDARVDSRITQFMRETGRGGMQARSDPHAHFDPHAGPDPHVRRTDPQARAGAVTRSVTAGQSTDARLRELYARVDAAASPGAQPMRAGPRQGAAAPARGQRGGLQAAPRESRRDLVYDF